jgi:cell cycle checkpoint protein
MVFLDKSLFSSYQFHPPANLSQHSSQGSDDATLPAFSVSLPSLLAALQVFGSGEPAKPNPWKRDAFSNDAFSADVLGISGICRIRYDAIGSALNIVLEESQLTTNCELVTYEPVFSSDIPFSRDELAIKVIMGASYLFDAISEIANTNAEKLKLSATASHFSLSSSSELGATAVRFHRDAKIPGETQHQQIGVGKPNQNDPSAEKSLLETFLVSNESFGQFYKFSHISITKRALSSAIKVSVRVDSQGVLSLQFMIENMDGQGVSFVDFRFVPLIKEEQDEDEDEEDISTTQ